MLTSTEEDAARLAPAVLPSKPNKTSEASGGGRVSHAGRSRLAKVMRLEWIGQTVASLCWIASVLVYGVSSTGDWLQLFAASAWLTANIAAAASTEDD